MKYSKKLDFKYYNFKHYKNYKNFIIKLIKLAGKNPKLLDGSYIHTIGLKTKIYNVSELKKILDIEERFLELKFNLRSETFEIVLNIYSFENLKLKSFVEVSADCTDEIYQMEDELLHYLHTYEYKPFSNYSIWIQTLGIAILWPVLLIIFLGDLNGIILSTLIIDHFGVFAISTFLCLFIFTVVEIISITSLRFKLPRQKKLFSNLVNELKKQKHSWIITIFISTIFLLIGKLL